MQRDGIPTVMILRMKQVSRHAEKEIKERRAAPISCTSYAIDELKEGVPSFLWASLVLICVMGLWWMSGFRSIISASL